MVGELVSMIEYTGSENFLNSASSRDYPSAAKPTPIASSDQKKSSLMSTYLMSEPLLILFYRIEPKST